MEPHSRYMCPYFLKLYMDRKGYACCGSSAQLTTQGSNQHFLRMKCSVCGALLGRIRLPAGQVLM